MFSIEKINQLNNNLIEVCKGYIPEETLNQFKNEVNAKLKQEKPGIMLYGVYNAGKSTLINALLGREEAKIGDVPTTAEVHQYEWEGFPIYDTPGINAPIEHEAVTEEHLKKTEVVLFVMSNQESHDEQIIYDKIKHITEKEKKLIVIVNDKKVEGIESENLSRILIHINSNLREKCNLTELRVLPINAQTAKNGQLENKELLVEKSGLNEIKQEIISQFSKIGKTDIYNTTINFILDRANEFRNIIEDKKDDKALKTLNKILSTLNRLTSDLKSKYRDQIRISQNNIKQKIMDASSVDENTVNQIIESSLKTEMGRITSQFQEHVEKAQREEEINLKFNDPNLDTSKYGIQLEQNKDIELIDTNNNELQNKTIDYLKNMTQNKELMTNLSKEALLQMRKFKIPFIKGRWEKTLGKWAGNFGKYVGPAVQIVSGIYEVWQAKKQQEEMERQQIAVEQNKIQALSQIADEINSNFSKQLINDFEENFENNGFEKLRKEYLKQTKETEQQHDAISGALNKINQIESELNSIKSEIPSS